MDNLLFFIIIIGLILIIYYIHITSPVVIFDTNTKSTESENRENFDLLSMTPFQRCNLMDTKKFMIRDLRTKLWLISGKDEGFNKFLPGRFGNVFMMSENPDEFLPLRTVTNPNNYLIATNNGDNININTDTNPYNQYHIIQIFIYNGYNVLGYINKSNLQLYLYIDNDGHITSSIEPKYASTVEIIEI